MPLNREQAVELAVRFYSHRVTVIRSRDDLPGVRADIVFVLSHATHTSAFSGLELSFTRIGPGWWVAFEELRREVGRWGPPDIHPSGGLVHICEATGSVYEPSLL